MWVGRAERARVEAPAAPAPKMNIKRESAGVPGDPRAVSAIALRVLPHDPRRPHRAPRSRLTEIADADRRTATPGLRADPLGSVPGTRVVNVQKFAADAPEEALASHRALLAGPTSCELGDLPRTTGAKQ